MIGELILCASLTAVDGDTVRCDGELLRLLGSGTPHVSGFDTGELRTYRCKAEKAIAQRAHARLKTLVVDAQIIDTAERDRTQYQRRLVRLRTSNGEFAGDILLREGLARRWPDGRHWCNSAQHNGSASRPGTFRSIIDWFIGLGARD